MMSLPGFGAEGAASSENTRKKEFKRTVTQEDGRRKRTENAIQIRKNKRAEGLRKRRAMARKAPAAGTAAATNSLAALADTAVAGMPSEVDIKHLSAYQAGKSPAAAARSRYVWYCPFAVCRTHGGGGARVCGA